MKNLIILILLSIFLSLQSIGQIVIPNDSDCDPALLPMLITAQAVNISQDSAVFNLDISNCDESCTLTLVPSNGGEAITTGSGTSVTFLYPEDLIYQIFVQTQLEYDVIINNGICEPTTIPFSFFLPFAQADEEVTFVEDLPIVLPGVSESSEIPTLGQWGLFCTFLILLIIPIVTIRTSSIALSDPPI